MTIRGDPAGRATILTRTDTKASAVAGKPSWR
jgi:hypothetical protein